MGEWDEMEGLGIFGVYGMEDVMGWVVMEWYFLPLFLSAKRLVAYEKARPFRLTAPITWDQYDIKVSLDWSINGQESGSGCRRCLE